ncbi:MAG: peptide deformylase [Chlamydiae bacterium]|nr:MAG: peptide deformylase [Chlamydiota bacterium]
MILPITYEKEPSLHRPSQPVTVITNEILDLIDDMFETMNQSNGIGLAAPQVGKNIRVIIVDILQKKSKPFALINPEIVHAEGEQFYEEGCLSCPGLSGNVKRAAKVTVLGLDESGNDVKIDAEKLLAVVLQHEIDHLDGILFIDRLDEKEKQKIEKQRKLAKM